MSAEGALTPSEDPKLAVLAGEIAEGLQAIEIHWQATMAYVIEVGQKLIEAKALLNKHGEWLRWLSLNFEPSRRTAENYMRIARNAQRVAHLPTVRDAVKFLADPKPDVLPKTPVRKSEVVPAATTAAPEPATPEQSPAEEEMSAEVRPTGRPEVHSAGAVLCPVCKAPPGDKCWKGDGESGGAYLGSTWTNIRTTPHKARIDLFEEHGQEAEEIPQSDVRVGATKVSTAPKLRAVPEASEEEPPETAPPSAPVPKPKPAPRAVPPEPQAETPQYLQRLKYSVSGIRGLRDEATTELQKLSPEQVWRVADPRLVPEPGQVGEDVLIGLERAALDLSFTVSYLVGRLLRPDQPESWGPEPKPTASKEDEKWSVA